MNNDLISREALKKALKSNCDLCHDKNTNWCENCCPHNDFEDLIDNAPSVEISKLILIVATRSGKREMMLNALRPQGEWIDHSEEGYVECPFCGAVPHKLYKNFCAKCGAKMKGGAE